MAYISGYWVDSTNIFLAPFPEWFQSDIWRNEKRSIETLGRSIFPLGTTFVLKVLTISGVVILLIERMIFTCCPRLEDNRILGLVFAIILLCGQNLTCISIFLRDVWLYHDKNHQN